MNIKFGYSPEKIKKIQEIVGTKIDAMYGKKTLEAVRKYQKHLSELGLYERPENGLWNGATETACEKYTAKAGEKERQVPFGKEGKWKLGRGGDFEKPERVAFIAQKGATLSSLVREMNNFLKAKGIDYEYNVRRWREWVVELEGHPKSELPDRLHIGDILWVKGSIVEVAKAKPADYAEKTPPKDFSKMSPQEFIRAIAPYAQASQRATGVPASVTIAQAILETGWGKYANRIPNNFFGMKGTGPAGSVVVTTHEYEEGSRVVKKQRFRKYHNIEESFIDHARLLSRSPRYREAMKYTDEPNRFAREIHKAGYSTDPRYSDKLIKLMKQYNLYQYDRKEEQREKAP